MYVGHMLPMLLLCAVPSAAYEDQDYDIVEGDIQVPREGRSGAVLSASPLTRQSQLFPLGQVRYYIETEAVNAEGATPMEADDVRVLGAVAHWEAKTCIRFTKCLSAEGCALPYIKFIAGSGCHSPVGTSATSVNTIILGSRCPTGKTIHEIGHSLGLTHEQNRKDRDEYVVVDMTAVQTGKGHNFNKMGSSGRDLGAYDYSSIMHYSSTASSNGNGPTIIAPQRIGQRSSLSRGDVAAIQFMYNECSADYVRPTCMPSIDTTQTHLIPHSKAWGLDISMMYASSKSVAVSYEGTTAPEGQIAYSRASGSSMGNMDFTELTFTPSAAVAGQTFTLSATFTGTDGPSTTCAVRVRVADTDTLCFGIGASDPNVCSGHGTCVDDVMTPCQCAPGYVGVDCSGTVACPADVLYPFDGVVTWSTSIAGSVTEDSSVFVAGGASMRVGEVGSSSPAQAYTHFTDSEPHTVSFYMSAMGGGTQQYAAVYLRRGSATCAHVERSSTGEWRVGDHLVPNTAPEADRFYAVKLEMDWTAMTYRVLIDGQFLFSTSMPSTCAGGLSRAIFSGNGWLDEFKLQCTTTGLMQCTHDVVTVVQFTDKDNRQLPVPPSEETLFGGAVQVDMDVIINAYTNYGRFLDIGNGVMSDNFIIGQYKNTGYLYVTSTWTAPKSRVIHERQLPLGETFHLRVICVPIDDATSTYYVYIDDVFAIKGVSEALRYVTRSQVLIGVSSFGNAGTIPHIDLDGSVTNCVMVMCPIPPAPTVPCTGDVVTVVRFTDKDNRQLPVPPSEKTLFWGAVQVDMDVIINAYTNYGRFLDIGNGVTSDNFIIGQYKNTGYLYVSSTWTEPQPQLRVIRERQLPLGETFHLRVICVPIDDATSTYYVYIDDVFAIKGVSEALRYVTRSQVLIGVSSYTIAGIPHIDLDGSVTNCVMVMCPIPPTAIPCIRDVVTVVRFTDKDNRQLPVPPSEETLFGGAVQVDMDVIINAYTNYGRFVDIGNGVTSDNFIIGQYKNTGYLYVSSTWTAPKSRVIHERQLPLGETFHLRVICVPIDDATSTYYVYIDDVFAIKGVSEALRYVTRSQVLIGVSSFGNAGTIPHIDLDGSVTNCVMVMCPYPPSPPTYIGCYVDRIVRDVDGPRSDTHASPELCSEFCLLTAPGAPYLYMGLQFSKACFCGNSYGTYGSAPESQCSMTCAQDPSSKCGAGWRNSLYKIGFWGP